MIFSKRISEIAEQFDAITIKQQMKILAQKSVNSKLFYKEIIEEFERTLFQALLDKYDYNISMIALHVKLHRNTVMKKMKKLKIKDKRSKHKEN